MIYLPVYTMIFISPFYIILSAFLITFHWFSCFYCQLFFLSGLEVTPPNSVLSVGSDKGTQSILVKFWNWSVILPFLWTLPQTTPTSDTYTIGTHFLSFLFVGSSVLLLMAVQQLVAILVLSQEEISECPSALPSWTGNLSFVCVCSFKIFIQILIILIYPH